jgi:hypothetical protein
MKPTTYRAIKAKLTRVGCINWKQVLAVIHTLDVNDSAVCEATLKGPRPHSGARKINLTLERPGDATYMINSERFGPKTAVDEFLEAVDGY